MAVFLLPPTKPNVLNITICNPNNISCLLMATVTESLSLDGQRSQLFLEFLVYDLMQSASQLCKVRHHFCKGFKVCLLELHSPVHLAQHVGQLLCWQGANSASLTKTTT